MISKWRCKGGLSGEEEAIAATGRHDNGALVSLTDLG
jgi:hypothetical protein